METVLKSVQNFSLSEINVNLLSKRVDCIPLVTQTNSGEVRTVSVLHVKAPVKSYLGCIHINPMDNPENSVYQGIINCSKSQNCFQLRIVFSLGNYS